MKRQNLAEATHTQLFWLGGGKTLKLHNLAALTTNLQKNPTQKKIKYFSLNFLRNRSESPWNTNSWFLFFILRKKNLWSNLKHTPHKNARTNEWGSGSRDGEMKSTEFLWVRKKRTLWIKWENGGSLRLIDWAWKCQ